MRTITLILAFAAAAPGQQLMECASGTVSYSSFTATATQEVTILTGVGNVRYDHIIVSETTKFNNITGLTVSMGRPGQRTNAELVDRFPLGESSGDINFGNTRPNPPQLTWTYAVVLAFAVPAATLNVANAGVLTWEVCGYGGLNVVQATSYLVGDVAPYTSDTAPNFGDGTLDILDLSQVLFAVNNVPGFRPAACSDRFDAMDLYPIDTALSRGGDGVLDIRDLVREYSRVNNLDLSRPVRPSQGGTCTRIAAVPSTRRNTEFSLGPRATQGRLVLGAPECSIGTEQRFPIYLDASLDLVRVAVTFALGNHRSRLRFVATPDAPPSLADDNRLGLVALAWLEGVSVRAGERFLLGHMVGPAELENLEIYSISAVGLDNEREVLLDASIVDETRPLVSQTDTDALLSVKGEKRHDSCSSAAVTDCVTSACTAGGRMIHADLRPIGSSAWTVINGGGGGAAPGEIAGDDQSNRGNRTLADQSSSFSGGTLVQRAVECASGTTSYTALTAATTNQEITIQTGISGNVRYTSVILSETAQFASATGLTVSMGRPGSTTHAELTNGINFRLQVSSGDFSYVSTRPTPPQITSTYGIVLNFAVTSGNVNAVTAGGLTWEVCGYSAR